MESILLVIIIIILLKMAGTSDTHTTTNHSVKRRVPPQGERPTLPQKESPEPPRNAETTIKKPRNEVFVNYEGRSFERPVPSREEARPPVDKK